MDDTDVEHLDVDQTVVDYADVTAHDDSFRDFSDEDDHTVGSLGIGRPKHRFQFGHLDVLAVIMS